MRRSTGILVSVGTWASFVMKGIRRHEHSHESWALGKFIEFQAFFFFLLLGFFLARRDVESWSFFFRFINVLFFFFGSSFEPEIFGFSSSNWILFLSPHETRGIGCSLELEQFTSHFKVVASSKARSSNPVPRAT